VPTNALPIISSKVRPPDIQARVVARPRLEQLIAELAHLYGIVWVTGSAGSGKTTAVLEAARSSGRPLAWLTLDTTERAPGRLLMYLQEALTRALPELSPVATDALAVEIPHVEAAGLLAEAVGGAPVTIVIDELERIADSDEARATLETFLRYAAPGVHAILISRRSVKLRLGSARELGGVGRVGEAQLAFTVEEAQSALSVLGSESADAQSAVEATGGWVAGVLFDAWRSPQHAHGAGGEADALNSYLSSEIMGDLAPEQQEFLISTSLLAEVTPARAEALGQTAVNEIMSALRAMHLPVAFATDRLSMRCHTRFREYLQGCLHGGEGRDLRALQAAYGRLLVTEGQHEDAVDVLLQAGDLMAAQAAAEIAVAAVLRRLDFDVAAEWLKALPREAVEGSEELTYAALLIAIEREEFVIAAACADRLMARASADETITLNPGLAVAMALAYFLVSRLDDALEVIDHTQDSPQGEAISFSIRVDLIDDATHYRERPANCGDAVDGLLARVDLAHGRFARLLEPSATPWGATYSSRIAALRALGRFDEALALCLSSPFTGWTMTRVYVELMADMNQPEKAAAELHAGRELVKRSGLGFGMFNLLLETMLALRFDRDTKAAAAALAKVERVPTALRRLRIVEQIELWHGLIGLLDGDDESAAIHLRRAVELMVHWDRLQFMPTAAVYLAEAEWRLENEEAADAAADLALEAAGRQGSDHMLLQALREFPAVASRRLDAEPDFDSAWHEIGRALMDQRLTPSGRLIARAHVREFGEPGIVIDGEEVQVKLRKSIELLAYLAAHGHRATKNELLDNLFNSRTDDSARSYLRQAVNRLRQALPADASLAVDGDEVVWSGGALTSDSIELRSTVEQARLLRGRPRLEATLAALELFERGEYLADAGSGWVETRRQELAELAADARHAAAEAAFELGEYRQADELAQGILRDDPFRESVWRLAMRIAGAMGHDDLVIARYRACEAALSRLEVAPAASTRQLLDRLRR
jgi:DNA-binding SARP family transcriptional activator